MNFICLFLLLCAGHALCDYSLQSDFIARGKNVNTAIPGMAWQQILLAHCLIHSGCVVVLVSLSRIIAGIPLDHCYQLGTILGLLELIIHYSTDWAKCENAITFNVDQSIHYTCKLAWALLSVI
jgi:hypothetical protein